MNLEEIGKAIRLINEKEKGYKDELVKSLGGLELFEKLSRCGFISHGVMPQKDAPSRVTWRITDMGRKMSVFSESA
ncbi:hypothetical protein [Viscerimonas tarda]